MHEKGDAWVWVLPELLKEGFWEIGEDRILRGRDIVSLEGEVLLAVIEEEHSRLMALGWGSHAGLHRYH